MYLSNTKPSVTELTKLLDKPALLSWANKIGLQGINIKDYRQKVMSAGTSMHVQIERHILHGEPFENEATKLCYDQFFLDKEIIGVEEKLECDYFTGRYDIKYICNGIVTIADFKTNQKRCYLENILQLAAYKFMSECDQCVIVSVPDFIEIQTGVGDYRQYQEIMFNLSNIHQILKENGKLY
jgi:hypothetical protein